MTRGFYGFVSTVSCASFFEVLTVRERTRLGKTGIPSDSEKREVDDFKAATSLFVVELYCFVDIRQNQKVRVCWVFRPVAPPAPIAVRLSASGYCS